MVGGLSDALTAGLNEQMRTSETSAQAGGQSQRQSGVGWKPLWVSAGQVRHDGETKQRAHTRTHTYATRC